MYHFSSTDTDKLWCSFVSESLRFIKRVKCDFHFNSNYVIKLIEVFCIRKGNLRKSCGGNLKNENKSLNFIKAITCKSKLGSIFSFLLNGCTRFGHKD